MFGYEMKLHSTTQSQLGPLELEFSYKYISLASLLMIIVGYSDSIVKNFVFFFQRH